MAQIYIVPASSLNGMVSLTDTAEQNGILSRLFETAARAKILDFFLDHKEFDYPIAEIAEKSGLSIRHVLRELPKLERMKLVIKSRKVGKASMYRLDTNIVAVTLLDKLSLELSRMPSFGDLHYKADVQAFIDDVARENDNKMNVNQVARDSDRQ